MRALERMLRLLTNEAAFVRCVCRAVEGCAESATVAGANPFETRDDCVTRVGTQRLREGLVAHAAFSAVFAYGNAVEYLVLRMLRS